MKNKTSNWLLVVVALLLIGLLVNQVFYAVNAADEQAKALNEKVEIALDVIVDKVSANQSVCKSVDKCLHTDNKQVCCKYLDGEKEWQVIDSVIQAELTRFKIDLNYNFDFGKYQPEDKNTYTMNMDQVFSEAGVVMYLEFPDRSKYLLRQMGPVFISSVLLILFITIAFVMMYRYYRQERELVNRTRDFINNMTHEFKTPLANISFAGNLIDHENAALKSPKIERFTQIILSENQRLIDNCEDLLAMGCAEQSLEQVMKDNIDLNEVIIQVINRHKRLDQENRVKWDIDLNASRSSIEGKLSFTENVVSNLIDNAVKYSEKELTISVKTRNEGDLIILEIKDNGIGIPKNKLNHIFDKFYRVSNQDQHDVKGFGLGLSYVKMIVEQMGGTVSVKSEVGKGSIFMIKLPVQND